MMMTAITIGYVVSNCYILYRITREDRRKFDKCCKVYENIIASREAMIAKQKAQIEELEIYKKMYEEYMKKEHNEFQIQMINAFKK